MRIVTTILFLFSTVAYSAPKVSKSPKIALEFNINNDGKMSKATIYTLNDQPAKIETHSNPGLLNYEIEAFPKIIEDKMIKITVRGKTQNTENQNSRSFNTSAVLKPGEEVTLTHFEDSQKNTFSISAKATLVE